MKKTPEILITFDISEGNKSYLNVKLDRKATSLAFTPIDFPENEMPEYLRSFFDQKEDIQSILMIRRQLLNSLMDEIAKNFLHMMEKDDTVAGKLLTGG